MRLSNSSVIRKSDFLPIGKIVGVHGLKGAVRVFSYSDSDSAFKHGEYIFIRKKSGSFTSKKILKSSSYKNILRVSMEGICTRDEALDFTGSDLFIKKDSLETLPEGLHYRFQLIGLSVYTDESRFLGIVESVFPTGGNDVFVVKKEEKEILIPAIDSVVVSVNTAQKIMRVKLPDGLI